MLRRRRHKNQKKKKQRKRMGDKIGLKSIEPKITAAEAENLRSKISSKETK